MGDRLPHGWWILPAMVAGAGCIALAVALAVGAPG